jgi:hypothetical protein
MAESNDRKELERRLEQAKRIAPPPRRPRRLCRRWPLVPTVHRPLIHQRRAGSAPANSQDLRPRVRGRATRRSSGQSRT